MIMSTQLPYVFTEEPIPFEFDYSELAQKVINGCLEYINFPFEAEVNLTLTNNEEKMLRKYTDDIVMLDDNYGFAKANNKGIEYARSKYNSDYYIVINNDVFITQKDFLKVIDKDYEKYKFDVLGPKIESPTGESVNPFPVFKTFNEVKFQIEKSKKLIKIYSNPRLKGVPLWLMDSRSPP